MEWIARNLNNGKLKRKVETMKNKVNILLIIFSLMMMFTIFPMPSWADDESKPAHHQVPMEDKVTGEISIGVLSAYIWRGQELTRHSIVNQPSMTVGYQGFLPMYGVIWILILI